MENKEELSLSFNFIRPPLFASELKDFGSSKC